MSGSEGTGAFWGESREVERVKESGKRSLGRALVREGPRGEGGGEGVEENERERGEV